jgi:hypothetical protein
VNTPTSPKLGLVTAITLFSLIGGFVAICGISYIAAYNSGNRYERQIETKWQDLESILAQYGNKVMEAGQIPDMQRDDLVKIVQATMMGRYGEGGSRASIQAIREQMPQLNQATYIQLQRMMESGRNEFTVATRQALDVKRQYQTALGSFWQGTWLGVAGYPKIDLTKYNIVTTDRANDTFKSGKETPIKLRP